MKTRNSILEWLTHGCVYYTVVSILFILISLASMEEGSEWTVPTNFWQLLPASMAFAAAGLLLRAKRVARWKRYLGHYIICLAAVVIFFFLMSGARPTPVSMLLMLTLLTALYWAVFGLVLLVGAKLRRLFEED